MRLRGYSIMCNILEDYCTDVEICTNVRLRSLMAYEYFLVALTSQRYSCSIAFWTGL